MKYIVDIKGEIEGDYEIICKYEEAPKGDLISREALKEAISDIELSLTNKRTILNIIDNAPTVEPDKVLVANVTFDEDKLKEIVQTEVIDKIKSGELVLKNEKPQGEWEKIGEIGLAYKCNKCGEVSVIPTKFCPNCGAWMKGGAE